MTSYTDIRAENEVETLDTSASLSSNRRYILPVTQLFRHGSNQVQQQLRDRGSHRRLDLVPNSVIEIDMGETDEEDNDLEGGGGIKAPPVSHQLHLRDPHKKLFTSSEMIRLGSVCAFIGIVFVIGSLFVFGASPMMERLVELVFHGATGISMFTVGAVAEYSTVTSHYVRDAIERGDIQFNSNGFDTMFFDMAALMFEFEPASVVQVFFAPAAFPGIIALNLQPAAAGTDKYTAMLKLGATADRTAFFDIVWTQTRPAHFTTFDDGYVWGERDAWGEGPMLWDGVGGGSRADQDPRTSDWYMATVDAAQNGGLSPRGQVWRPNPPTNIAGDFEYTISTLTPVYSRVAEGQERELLGVVGVTSSLVASFSMILEQLNQKLFAGFSGPASISILSLEGDMFGSTEDIGDGIPFVEELPVVGGRVASWRDADGLLPERRYEDGLFEDEIVMLASPEFGGPDFPIRCLAWAERDDWYDFVFNTSVLTALLLAGAVVVLLLLRCSKFGRQASHQELGLTFCLMAVLVGEYLLWDAYTGRAVDEVVAQSMSSLDVTIRMALNNSMPTAWLTANTLAQMVNHGLVSLPVRDDPLGPGYINLADPTAAQAQSEAAAAAIEPYLHDTADDTGVGAFIVTDHEELYLFSSRIDETEDDNKGVFNDRCMRQLYGSNTPVVLSWDEQNRVGNSSDPIFTPSFDPTAFNSGSVNASNILAQAADGPQTRWLPRLVVHTEPSYVLVKRMGATSRKGECASAGACVGGVAGAFITIEELTAILEAPELGVQNTLFIVDRSAADPILVSTTNSELDDVSEAVLTFPRDAKDPLTLAGHKELMATFGSYEAVEDRIEQYGDLLISTHSHRDSSGLNWLLVIVVPRSEYYHQLDDMERLNTYLLPPIFLALLLYPALNLLLMGMMASKWDGVNKGAVLFLLRRLFFFSENRKLNLELVLRKRDPTRCGRLSASAFRSALQGTGFGGTGSELDVLVSLFGARAASDSYAAAAAAAAAVVALSPNTVAGSSHQGGADAMVDYTSLLAAMETELMVYFREKAHACALLAHEQQQQQQRTAAASSPPSWYSSARLLKLRLYLCASWLGVWRYGPHHRESVETRHRVRKSLYMTRK